MIKTFSDKQTQKLFEGENPRKFRAFQRQADRKLQLLDMAVTLDFLRVTGLKHLLVIDKASTAYG